MSVSATVIDKEVEGARRKRPGGRREEEEDGTGRDGKACRQRHCGGRPHMSSARAKAGRPGRQWRSSSPTVKGFGVLDKSGTVCALRLTKLGFFFLKKLFSFQSASKVLLDG